MGDTFKFSSRLIYIKEALKGGHERDYRISREPPTFVKKELYLLVGLGRRTEEGY